MSPLPSIVNNRNLSSSRLHKTLSRQAVRKCVKWGISRHQGFPGATLSANALYRASRRTYSDSTLRDSTPFIFYDSRRHPERPPVILNLIQDLLFARSHSRLFRGYSFRTHPKLRHIERTG